MSKAYTIQTSDGRQHRALRATYPTRDAAVGALSTVLGWVLGAHLSDDYTVTLPDDPETGRPRYGRAWSCYETEAERDRDADGAHAPRVIEGVAS